MKKEKRSKLNFDLLCEEIPYEQLFVEEFETPIIEIEKEEETNEVEVKDQAFVNEVFNPDFTMPKAVEQLLAYMKDNGIRVDLDSARSLFAAFASSRLVFLNADDKELLSEFIRLLGAYFNCERVSVDFASLGEEEGDVINDVNGITPIGKALLKDGDYRDYIRIMTINEMQSEKVRSYMQQVIKYIDQPDKGVMFSVMSEGKSYNMPSNIWFVLSLCDEQKVIDIPKYILETACSLDIMMRPVEGYEFRREQLIEEQAEEQIDEQSEEQAVKNDEKIIEEKHEQEKPSFEILTYHQFAKMIEVARRNCMLDETLWKRLDKLEEFIVSIDAAYRINNKMWQRIEKYVSVYLSAGGTNEEAIDNVVAHQVVNTMAPSLIGNKNKDNIKFAYMIENIFGEGHVPHSIKAIKSTGLKI